MPHGNAYLAQHPVGGDLGYADLFGQPHGGNTALVRGDQVDRPEPLGQGEVGGVKQRPRCERGLVMTLGAFVTVTRGDGIAMVMPAARATEPFRRSLAAPKAWAQASSVPYRFCQSGRFVSVVFMMQLLVSLITKR